MRKYFFLLGICLLSFIVIRAERIDVASARKVAENVVQRSWNPTMLRSSNALSLVYVASSKEATSMLRSEHNDAQEADYYVFNVSDNQGFVIVAGDNRVRPVLGYSEKGHFDPDNMPENFRKWLSDYRDQMNWVIIQDKEVSPALSTEWESYLHGGSYMKSGKEVLLKTATWGQDDPYNRKTPLYDNKHLPTGCIPTAMGILMKYHKFPEQADSDKRVTSFYNQPVSYGKYNWESMPDKLDGSSSSKQIEAVSELLWHTGANANVQYSLDGSGAFMVEALAALRDVFGYSKQMRHIIKDYYSDYSWEEWEQIMRDQLEKGQPILYASETEERVTPFNGKSHAFICDGYDSYGRFHFNWGWNGAYNGFYLLSALDPTNNEYWGGYNQGHNMIVNIKPNNESENRIELQLTESVQGDGFQLHGGEMEDAVIFPVENKGNIPFSGYLGYALTDRDGNIKKIGGYNNEITNLPLNGDVWRNICLVKMSDNDYVMAVYSTDKKNWAVIKGASAEIADKMSIKGPVSNEKVYYGWELDCRNEGLVIEAPEKLEYNKPVELLLKPKKGYGLPKAQDISIKMAYYQSLLVNNPGYGNRATASYDEKTGKLSISCVYGHVHIATEGVQIDDNLEKYNDTSLKSMGYTLNGNQHEIKLRDGWKSYTVLLSSKEQGAPQITLHAEANQSGAKVEVANPVWIDNTAVGKIKVVAVDGVSSTTYAIAFKHSQPGVDPEIPDVPDPDDQVLNVTSDKDVTSVKVKTINVGNTQGKITPSFTSVHTDELNILAGTDVGIGLLGHDNQLGKITNNGSLQIFNLYKKGSATCSSFVNNGSVMDITGSITKVEGHAALEIMPITVSGNGGTRVLEGRALGNNVKLSWYKGDEDGDSWTPLTQMKTEDLKTEGASDKITVSESGVYRLEAVVSDGAYYTNLSSIVEVDINKTYYRVTLPIVEGVEIFSENSTTVEADSNFAFTIHVQDGYDGEDMVVKANGIHVPVDAFGHCLIENIQSDVIVSVTGIVKKDPTSIESVSVSKTKVWGFENRLHIQSSIQTEAFLYTMDGRLYKTLNLPIGEVVVDIPHGSYIVRIGEKTYKLNL